jgi:hypothetical protein
LIDLYVEALASPGLATVLEEKDSQPHRFITEWGKI